jgi:transcription elongation factor GreB
LGYTAGDEAWKTGMARWREPRPRSSPYITAGGERALRSELRELWLRRRQEVVPALSAAAAEGDRSENAEYIYRKKQLAEIDRRVRYLSRRLDEVTVVHAAPHDRGKVFFGAFVTLERASSEVRYRIVGADETDAAQGFISIDSPLARALLGRRPGEEIEVELPDGRQAFRVLAIDYE